MLSKLDTILIGSIPNDLEEVISYNVDRAIKGEIEQFLFGLDAYLTGCPDAKEYYKQKGIDALRLVVDANPKKVDFNMFNSLPDSYFVFNGALEEGVLIGFDMEKEGCPRALYTRNFKIINEMVSLGCISNADKVAKAEASVKGVKTINGMKNVEEALIGVARLDFEGIVGGVPKYKVVVPQQPLRVGLNTPMLMTPLKAIAILSTKLDKVLANNVVRFTENTVKGIKQGVTTSNEGIVRVVYKQDEDVTEYNHINKRIELINPGYNYNLLRYFSYDVESSLYSKGYCTFRPEMLDRLEVVDVEKIDKSKHRLNYRLMRDVYKDKVKNLDLDDMYSITFYDLSSFSTLDDKCDALLTYGDELGNSELYTLMKQNADIFGDLQEELALADARQPKIVKALKIVKNPSSAEEFKDMVANGLAKVTTITKKGKVMEAYVTNNPKLLKTMIGKDYIRTLESPRYRYTEFKKIVENTNFESRDQIESLALKYGIDVGIVVNNVNSVYDGDVSRLVDGIDKHLDELSAKRKNRTLSPSMVTVRDVYARESKDLYTTIDVNQIKQIEYAPMG